MSWLSRYIRRHASSHESIVSGDEKSKPVNDAHKEGHAVLRMRAAEMMAVSRAHCSRGDVTCKDHQDQQYCRRPGPCAIHSSQY